jgi:hypothetical protein
MFCFEGAFAYSFTDPLCTSYFQNHERNLTIDPRLKNEDKIELNLSLLLSASQEELKNVRSGRRQVLCRNMKKE